MRRTSRTRLAIVAAVAALALPLAGCSGTGSDGGSAKSGDGHTLSVLLSVNPGYPQEQQAWFKTIGAEFKKKTGASVQWETFATSDDEMTRIQTAVASGQGPDVYGLGTTLTPTAYSTGAFVKFTNKEWEAVGGRDRFVPSSLDISGPDENNEIGVPFVSKPYVMAYNAKLLAAAGIDKPATSWDELAAQAKRLTGNGHYGLAIDYKDNLDPWKYIWAMSAEAGTQLIDGNKAKLDDPAVKKAFQTYFGWLTDDKVVDPASVGWANAQAVTAFADGKAAYLPLTTQAASITLDASAVKDDYKFALMPTIPPGHDALPSNGVASPSILSGNNLAVADYSQQKDLAYAFIELITSKSVQLDYFSSFKEFPVNAEAAAQLKGDPVYSIAVEASAKSVATPFNGAWGDVQAALTNVVVQSIPELSHGSVSDQNLSKLLADGQSKVQAAVDRAK